LSRHYQIREFAELAGVTVKALHHYDRLGLLRPARTAAGYRVYSESDQRFEKARGLPGPGGGGVRRDRKWRRYKVTVGRVRRSGYGSPALRAAQFRRPGGTEHRKPPGPPPKTPSVVQRLFQSEFGIWRRTARRAAFGRNLLREMVAVTRRAICAAVLNLPAPRLVRCGPKAQLPDLGSSDLAPW